MVWVSWISVYVVSQVGGNNRDSTCFACGSYQSQGKDKKRFLSRDLLPASLAQNKIVPCIWCCSVCSARHVVLVIKEVGLTQPARSWITKMPSRLFRATVPLIKSFHIVDLASDWFLFRMAGVLLMMNCLHGVCVCVLVHVCAFSYWFAVCK